MIEGIWRSTHFLLALSVSFFLIIVSITGTYLGIEAAVDQTKEEAVYGLNKLNLRKTMDSIQNNFDEVYEISITEKNFVLVQGITSDGFETVYANPKTGEKIETVKTKNSMSNLMRNLHRSLFLKKTGRFIVGFISFLSVLLVITGFLLLLRRIGGFKNILNKFNETHFLKKTHIELGRVFILPILIVTISGVYLSVNRFNIFKNDQSTQYEYKAGEKYIDLNKISLNQVKKITYPFTSSYNDTYKVELSNRSIIFQQGDNSIIKEVLYPNPILIQAWAYWIHTGENNIILALILSLTAFTLLFFIISGFWISSKNSWNIFKISVKNLGKAEIIIFYGSETGKTFKYAKGLLKKLIINENKVALCSLNKYRNFPKARAFIFLTATYGDGVAPSNANSFENKFKKYKQLKSINYAVLGFGSKSYPKFCRYAEIVNSILIKEENFNELYPLFKINNQDQKEYNKWEEEIISRFSSRKKIESFKN